MRSRSASTPLRLAAIAGLAVLLAACGGRGREPAQPSIVLISLDTLRADRLTAYGYPRPTSPTLEAFAGEAVRFADAHAQATATLPSHLSLFTSRLPPEIGITQADGRNDTQARTRLRLSDGVPTLAEILRAAGYRTAAFTDGGLVHPDYGLARGFDHFSMTTLEEGAYRNGFRRSIERLASWLGARSAEDREAPAFLFVHTYDVHEPYDPPQPFARAFSDIDYPTFQQRRGFPARPAILSERRASLTEKDVRRVDDLYDNGVLATDHALGVLFETLEAADLYRDAIVVVLSDHGEELLDHGDYGHGPRVYQELARVPLLVRLPGGREGGRVVEAPVALLDVAPTLLALIGHSVPADMRGRSLAGLIDGRDASWTAERPIFIGVPDRTRDVSALRRGRWKLVRDVGDDATELYDLARDPRELHDLAKQDPERAARMRSELEQWVRALRVEARREGTLAVPAETAPDAGRQEALRALGYLR